MDWTSSGITNSFEFELVDSANLDERKGWLDGVTGGSVTIGYRADYRISAQLDLDDISELPWSCAVRVWHTAADGSESVRQELATLFPEPIGGRLENGRRSGSVRLYGPMKALAGDIFGGEGGTGAARGVAAGTAVKPYFENRVKAARRTPRVMSFAENATMGYHVWEPGTSCLEEMQAVADACGGYLWFDSHGRVVLEPYQLPASRAESFTVPSGAASLTLIGVDITSPVPINKVVCTHETQVDGASYFVTRSAQVDTSHPWHPNRIGYWAGASETPPSIPEGADVGAVLQAYANQRLKELTDTRRTFSAVMLYHPDVAVGRVGRFVYRDSDDGEGLDVRCFVSEMDITLDAAMRCQLTLEEV